MTATDIAVRLGMAEGGDASKVARIDEAFANKALDAMRGASFDLLEIDATDGGCEIAGEEEG